MPPRSQARRTRDPFAPVPAPQPSPHVVAILRRCAAGYMQLHGEEGPPQRYRARTPADGLLPRFRNG
jgi:hypothetical protein